MSKKDKAAKRAAEAKAIEEARDARIRALTAIVADGTMKKKVRKMAEEELHVLVEQRGAFVPTEAPTDGPEPAAPQRTGADWYALVERAGKLKQRIAATSEPSSAVSEHELAGGYDKRDDEDEVAYQWRKKAEREAADAYAKARVTIEEPEQPEADAADPSPVPGPLPLPTPGGLPFEVAEDPVLSNGQGRPQIWAPDPKDPTKPKLTLYTRATTYIKGLDDTTNLEKWGKRTLLEGAYLEEAGTIQDDVSSVQAVGHSMERRDAALARLDAEEAAGNLSTALEREAAVKEHRDFTNRIVENLLDIGGAHEKADAGTRLHRLSEYVDQDEELPEWATASERLDIEAYRRACKIMGLKVLWSERRVVVDSLKVTGTMDRVYQWMRLAPGRTRRSTIRAVGDLKTGSVEWGPGKIGMQLALYAMGEGYTHDPEHLEREDLDLSENYALLIHLPAGEHRCTIYEVDLRLSRRGLDLAADVREWRNAGKKVYDLKAPLASAEVGVEEATA